MYILKQGVAIPQIVKSMDCRSCYKYILFEGLEVSGTTNKQRSLPDVFRIAGGLEVSGTTNKQKRMCGFFYKKVM